MVALKKKKEVCVWGVGGRIYTGARPGKTDTPASLQGWDFHSV